METDDIFTYVQFEKGAKDRGVYKITEVVGPPSLNPGDKIRLTKGDLREGHILIIGGEKELMNVMKIDLSNKGLGVGESIGLPESPVCRTTRQQTAKSKMTLAKPKPQMPQTLVRVRNDYKSHVKQTVGGPVLNSVIDNSKFADMTEEYEKTKVALSKALKMNLELATEQKKLTDTLTIAQEKHVNELSELRNIVAKLEHGKTAFEECQKVHKREIVELNGIIENLKQEKALTDEKCLKLQQEKLEIVPPLCTTCHDRNSKAQVLGGTVRLLQQQLDDLLEPSSGVLTVHVEQAVHQPAVRRDKPAVKRARPADDLQPNNGKQDGKKKRLLVKGLNNSKEPKKPRKMRAFRSTLKGAAKMTKAEFQSQILIENPDEQLLFSKGTTGNDVLFFDHTMCDFVCGKKRFKKFKKVEPYLSRGEVYRALLKLLISSKKFIHISLKGNYKKMNKSMKLASLHAGVKKFIEEYLGAEKDETSVSSLAAKLLSDSRCTGICITDLDHPAAE